MAPSTNGDPCNNVNVLPGAKCLCVDVALGMLFKTINTALIFFHMVHRNIGYIDLAYALWFFANLRHSFDINCEVVLRSHQDGSVPLLRSCKTCRSEAFTKKEN